MKLLTRLAAACFAAWAAVSCLTLAAPATGAAQPSAAAAPSATAPVPACTNADLRASYRYDGSGAGSSFARIRLTNVSGHACRTGGYGGVSYVGDGDGTQIGHSAVREGGPAHSYVLRPGQRLVSSVRLVDPGVYSPRRCRPAKVDGFRVYVPNAYRSQFVAHRTTGCRNASVHLLFQRPYHRP